MGVGATVGENCFGGNLNATHFVVEKTVGVEDQVVAGGGPTQLGMRGREFERGDVAGLVGEHQHRAAQRGREMIWLAASATVRQRARASEIAIEISPEACGGLSRGEGVVVGDAKAGFVHAVDCSGQWGGEEFERAHAAGRLNFAQQVKRLHAEEDNRSCER